MEAKAGHPHEQHAAHEHHDEMPTEGLAVWGIATSATLHCLTGCAIGEVAGMAIGTALGFSDLGTIALAVALAFLFGYSLTSLPLLRAGLTLSAVVPIALAADTLSIGTMEVVDNAIMVIVPGAMEAGLGSILFWGSLSFALAVAFVLTVPVNRWLIARGKGHTRIHETGIHGGPPVRVVAAATIVAAVFGSAVLVGEALSSEDEGHGGGHAVAAGDLRLELGETELPRGKGSEVSFQILGADGAPLRDFDVEHERRMHMIVVRHDLTGFQHLHPRMAADGTWSTPITLPESGRYRVFADFTRAGTRETLGADLTVDGTASLRELPPPGPVATTEGGYRVELAAHEAVAGSESELAFDVSRAGEPVQVEPYLGAGGHLVAIREGDLEYLHVHPIEAGGHGTHGAAADGGNAIRFATEFPSEGRYRLFLQFKHRGEVRTAAFTQELTR